MAKTQSKRERLGSALRANLKKRRDQARARRENDTRAREQAKPADGTVTKSGG